MTARCVLILAARCGDCGRKRVEIANTRGWPRLRLPVVVLASELAHGGECSHCGGTVMLQTEPHPGPPRLKLEA